MATRTVQPSTKHSSNSSLQELHELQNLILRNEDFAIVMRRSGSTEEAARLAADHGINVTPQSLWRNRGKNGLPTWRA